MHASDNRRPAALILSPEAPYPIDGGGALRTASLLHYFAANYDLDLIAFQHPGQQIIESIPPGLTRSARVVELRKHANSFSAKARRNAGRLLRGRPPLVDRFSGYETQIEKHLQGRYYDFALIEHFWCASYLPLIGQFARRTILDLHNVESTWHESCAGASEFPQSAMHRSFGRAARRLEGQWLPFCDLVLATSEGDAERVRSTSPEVRICVYPNAIPSRDVITSAPEFAIGFSGNMEYEPNRSGLQWFIKEIWPELRREFPSLVFRLIGKNEHALSKEIRETPGVTCTGWIADPFTMLSAVQVCVVPLQAGSGTRLKIIEAWGAGRAVVSTPIGAEGLDAKDGENILIADKPDKFAEAVRRLLLDSVLRQNIAKEGRELFQQKYTWNVAWGILSRCIESDTYEGRVRL